LCKDSVDGLYYCPNIATTGAANMKYISQKPIPIPFSLSGVYLTGLSNTTTLQVNLTYYVEIFPTKNNILRRVAQPSTAMDANALKLYGGIIASLPTGVMVAENFLGGFISGVARIASGIARYGPQIARGIGAGMEVINSVSDMVNGSQRKTESIRDEEYVNTSPLQIVSYKQAASPKRVVEVKANSGKEMVVLPNSTRNQIVTVQSVGKSQSRSVTRNTGVVLTKGEKGRKRQNQAIRNAIQQNAGNRWVGGKQPR
jgi:hypothetical protein